MDEQKMDVLNVVRRRELALKAQLKATLDELKSVRGTELAMKKQLKEAKDALSQDEQARVMKVEASKRAEVDNLNQALHNKAAEVDELKRMLVEKDRDNHFHHQETEENWSEMYAEEQDRHAEAEKEIQALNQALSEAKLEIEDMVPVLLRSYGY